MGGRGEHEDPVEGWPEALERLAERSSGRLGRITVLRETASTQDAAWRLKLRPADVVVAARQTAGRGRMGRRWADTGSDGLALTAVTERGEPGALAAASAVGVALALEPLLGRGVDIKWPNDLLADGRKVAGILVEQREAVALVGIGINVTQRRWPAALRRRAVSLHQLGAKATRLEVLEAVLPALAGALGMAPEELRREFRARELLAGTVATFRHRGRLVRGRVVSADPIQGLTVRSGGGEIRLPGASTSVVRAEHRRSRPGRRA